MVNVSNGGFGSFNNSKLTRSITRSLWSLGRQTLMRFSASVLCIRLVMNPSKVVRENVRKLTVLPNIGKASAADLELLGIDTPNDLVGLDPYELYDRLCFITGSKHDPCVIDVFISVTSFINGDEPKACWHYTAERKSVQAAKPDIA
jgi:hypothetical protein